MSQLARLQGRISREADGRRALEEVRDRLHSLFGELCGACGLPWEDAIAGLHRDHTIPYLCGLVEDDREAADWVCDFEAEMARLGAIAEKGPAATEFTAGAKRQRRIAHEQTKLARQALSGHGRT